MRVAIVLAAGSGTRSGAVGNKVLAPLGGRPALAWPLETMAGASDAVVVVVRADELELASGLVDELDLGRPVAVVAGGASRHRSEVAGLGAARGLGAVGDDDLIAIHDGARPLVTTALVEALYTGAQASGGAWPALTAHGVLRRAGQGLGAVDNGGLLRAQTPQVFRAAGLHRAYEVAAAAGFEGTDTLETVLRHGDLECVVIEGDPVNIKVTHPEDFELAERLLAAGEGQRGGRTP